LAAVYGDDSQPYAQRQEALGALIDAYRSEQEGGALPGGAGNVLAEALAPIIERAAKQNAKAASPTEREEFVAHALAHVLSPRRTASGEKGLAPICTYHPERHPLEAWLKGVLRNAWISRHRRRKPDEPMGDYDSEVPDTTAGPWEVCDVETLLTVPFPEADLLRIDSWPPALRVEVVSLAGLSQKVPAERWEGWLTDYERARQIRLPRPFPPDDVRQHDRERTRFRLFAELFDYSPNLLSVRWKRGRDRLRDTDFVHGLG
jgi:hypothetical protein